MRVRALATSASSASFSPAAFAAQWIMYPPSGGCFPNIANGAMYEATILQQGGPEALRQWRELDRAMKPLQVRAGAQAPEVRSTELRSQRRTAASGVPRAPSRTSRTHRAPPLRATLTLQTLFPDFSTTLPEAKPPLLLPSPS